MRWPIEKMLTMGLYGIVVFAKCWLRLWLIENTYVWGCRDWDTSRPFDFLSIETDTTQDLAKFSIQTSQREFVKIKSTIFWHVHLILYPHPNIQLMLKTQLHWGIFWCSKIWLITELNNFQFSHWYLFSLKMINN